MTVTQTGPLIQKARISSIDIMRGIVMVIMALDHTRDFFHADALVFNPTDLDKTNPVLFFTRWITHFCAPTFVLLSGVAARISLQRKTEKELSVFLLTRGLWLILLEIVVIRFSFFFNFYYDFSFFQVIWVIGASMAVLSALTYLPGNVVLIIGLVILFGHNAFDSMGRLGPNDPGYVIWTLLNQSGPIQFLPGKTLIVAYPLLPWLGIMLLGYGLGKWYTAAYDAEKRQKLLLYCGLFAIALFILLRGFNLYGDPASWTPQKNGVFTVMSFLNATKYPVSLLYSLMTVGPVLIILSWMEKVDLSFLNPFVVFGRVPLFYYIVHFYLIHTTAIILYLIMSEKSFGDLDFHFSNGFGGLPQGSGYSLGWAYVAWICIVVVLYPVCRWYNRYKSTHNEWWLSYL